MKITEHSYQVKELEDRNSELAALLQQETHKSQQQDQYINELVSVFIAI